MAGVEDHQQDVSHQVPPRKDSRWCEGNAGKSVPTEPLPNLAQHIKWASSYSDHKSATQTIGNTYRQRAPSHSSTYSRDGSFAGHVRKLSHARRASEAEKRSSIIEITEPLPESILPKKIEISVIEKPAPVRQLKGRPKTTSIDDLFHAANTEPELARARAVEVLEEVEVEVSQQVEEMVEDKIEPVAPHAEIQERVSPVPIAYPSTQLPLRDRTEDPALLKKGKLMITVHKHSMQLSQITVNGFLIFSTWWWPTYYYITLPLITATVALNSVMVFSVILRRIWNHFRPEKIIMPATPEPMVFVIPCYNETKEEMLNSLDSLVSQKKVEQHKHAVIIICDGKVRGPGMEKSTGDYLLQDILTHRTKRKYITGAYTAWDQQPMDVVVQTGTYGGVPYMCIVKQQNQGKRDGLIVVRSFLYNFNRRHEHPNTIYSPTFFNEMCEFMVDDAQMDWCEHLVGMDADTVFAEDCVYQLLEESRYPNTVGVCGYVAVDWKDTRWNMWRLYQSCEYTVAQCLRRLHQSMVTHKVSCLPGCCQLLRVCEETCGDFVLIELFGYCPLPSDNLLKQIRATASEDRNHVCHMLMARPKVQTRQALKAKAFTDVPGSWAVFLSQRRRWTLGATSNDLLLMFGPGVQWFERITAGVNVTTWLLNPFIIASLASFIYSFLRKSSKCRPFSGKTNREPQTSRHGSSCASSASC